MALSAAEILTKELSSFFEELSLNVSFISSTDKGRFFFRIGGKKFCGFFCLPSETEFRLIFEDNEERSEAFVLRYDSSKPIWHRFVPQGYRIALGYSIQTIYLSNENLEDPHMKVPCKRGDILMKEIKIRDFNHIICYDKLSTFRFKSKIPEIQAWLEEQVASN